MQLTVEYALDKHWCTGKSVLCCCRLRVPDQLLEIVIEAVHKLHTGGVTALAVGHRVCATAGRDHHLRIWSVDFGALLLEVFWKVMGCRRHSRCPEAMSHDCPVECCWAQPYCQVFLAMSLLVWLQPRASMWPSNYRDSMQVQHQEPVVALALSPAAEICAVRTADGAIGIMDLQQESFDTVLRCHTSSIVGVAVHPTRCLLGAQ